MHVLRLMILTLVTVASQLMPAPGLTQAAGRDFDVLGLRMGMTREEVRDALPKEWLERKMRLSLYSIDVEDKLYRTESYRSQSPDEYLAVLPEDAAFLIATEWFDNGSDSLHLAFDGRLRLISVRLNLPTVPDTQVGGVYEQAIRKFGAPTDFRSAFAGNDYRVAYRKKLRDATDGQSDFFFKPDCQAEHERVVAAYEAVDAARGDAKAAAKDARKAAIEVMAACVVPSNSRWKTQVGPDETIARMRHHLEDPKSPMYGTGWLLWNCSTEMSDDAFRETFEPNGRVVTSNGTTTLGVWGRPAEKAISHVARLGIEGEVCAASVTRYEVWLQRIDLSALRAAAIPEAEVKIDF